MGIQPKLLICLATALVPLLTVGMFSIHSLDQQLNNTTKSALSNTQRLEAARISQILSEYAQDARSLAAGSHVRDFTTAINSHRYAHRARGLSKPEVSEMTIGGYDGFAIIDTASPWPLQQLALKLQRKAGMVGSSVVEIQLVDSRGNTLGESIGFSWDPVDPDLVARSMRSAKTTYGDAFRNDSGQDKLGIVSPIFSPKGQVVGGLLVEAQLGPIVNLIAKHEGVGYSSEAHIVQPTANGDAQFITPLRFDRQAAFQKVISRQSRTPAIFSLSNAEGAVLKAPDYRGVDSYLAIQTIAETGWGLVVKIDAEEAFAPVIELRRNLIRAIISSSAFFLALYLAWLMPVARRLKKTAAVARLIREGDLTVRIRDEYNDEISDTVSSINSLAYDLEQDQKKRTEVEARLRYQALHDDLTGLLNRKHANVVIQNLQEDRQHNHTVMFLDLNGFKDVNDLYGHSTGDKVLKIVAERLADEAPEGATLARWGGDEFVVILPHTNEEQATELALTLHDVIDEPITIDERVHSISCSIGLATSSSRRTLDDALIEADALMYEQKKRQRRDRSKSGLLARGVERALKEDRLEIWYQPILKLDYPGRSRLVGADTQLRLRTSDGGFVLPSEFMPEVENDQICRALDHKILGSAVQALGRWNAANIVNSEFQMKIQLTQRTLNDSAFPIYLQKVLDSFDVSPKQIIFELPANTGALDYHMLSRLKDFGLHLAINSESTEPNVLQLITALRPEIALIGQTWKLNSILLSHLIAACQDLGIELLALNVDNQQHMMQLYELGISQFQGALFEDPLTAVDFISHWGQTRLTGLGKNLTDAGPLRIAV